VYNVVSLPAGRRLDSRFKLVVHEAKGEVGFPKATCGEKAWQV